jgi:hypothetical protein
VRAPDWEQRLRALIRSAERRPFEWGVHDCALFAFAAYEAVTGRAHVHPETWANAAEAGRLLRAAPLIDRATAWYGQPVGFQAIRRGDLVLIGSERQWLGQPALAVCVGVEVACPGEEGLQFEALRHSFCGWRID